MCACGPYDSNGSQTYSWLVCYDAALLASGGGSAAYYFAGLTALEPHPLLHPHLCPALILFSIPISVLDFSSVPSSFLTQHQWPCLGSTPSAPPSTTRLRSGLSRSLTVGLSGAL